MQCDVSDTKQVATLFDKIPPELHNIDILGTYVERAISRLGFLNSVIQ